MKILLIENANLTKQLALSTRLISFSNYLIKKGDEVYILSGSESDAKIGSIKTFGCNSSTYSLQGNVKFVLNSKKHMQNVADIDIIHTYQPNLSSNAAVFVSGLKHKFHSKVINDIRSLWIEMGLAKLKISKERGEPVRKILYAFEKFFLKVVDYNFFITIDHQKHYSNMLNMNFNNSIIIPNTLENFAIIKSESTNKKIIFGYIGSLQKMRGLERIINIFSKIDGVELHLYGSPKLVNLPENVLYKGYVKYEAIPDVLSTFDVGLAHVSNEGNYWYQLITSMSAYPRKILEYMAASLPILASNQLAHTKTFGDIPLYYDPNDFIALQEKILFLRDNHEVRRKKGEYGLKTFRENYSLDVIGEKIRTIYKKL